MNASEYFPENNFQYDLWDMTQIKIAFSETFTFSVSTNNWRIAILYIGGIWVWAIIIAVSTKGNTMLMTIDLSLEVRIMTLV